MPIVPERPAGVTQPSATTEPGPRIPWEPQEPARWSLLGLRDGEPHARLPEDGSTADVLAWALVIPGATDPVEGMVDSVRVKLAALSDALQKRERHVADALHMLERQLGAAMLLLRRCDGRAPPPAKDENELAAERLERAPPEPGREEPRPSRQKKSSRA